MASYAPLLPVLICLCKEGGELDQYSSSTSAITTNNPSLIHEAGNFALFFLRGLWSRESTLWRIVWK
jgi:hypothetical protein